MGKRGPAKQPTKLRLLRGDPGKVGKRKNEPQPEPGPLVMPEWLVGLAADKWREITPGLEATGIATPIDTEALARYCDFYAQWRKYAEQVRQGEDVLVMRDQNGSVKYMQSSPSATMYVKLGQLLLRLEQEYGLTPSARASMEVPLDGQKIDDPFKKYGVG